MRNKGIEAVMIRPVKERRAISLLKVMGGAAVAGGGAVSSSLTEGMWILSLLALSTLESIESEVSE